MKNNLYSKINESLLGTTLGTNNSEFKIKRRIEAQDFFYWENT